MEYNEVLNGEVNFLSEDYLHGEMAIRAIKDEFNLIQLWQGMGRSFGIEARYALDRFIALSLRKFLMDEKSPLIKMCPNFKMPPLTGERFDCPGDDEGMKLIEIHTHIHVEPENMWIPVSDWLKERIAWIEKTEDDVPKVITDYFFRSLERKLKKTDFGKYYKQSVLEGNVIWKLVNPSQNSKAVYSILKENGYYDLTIGRMIKQIADKYGAHMDDKRAIWIRIANQSSTIDISAMSAFATQMIYATAKQVKGFEDFYLVNHKLEN